MGYTLRRSVFFGSRYLTLPRISPEALAELARLIQAAGGRLKGDVLKPIADLVRQRMPLPLTEQGIAEEAAGIGRTVRGLVKNYEPAAGGPEKALTREDVLQEALAALTPQIDLLPQARALTGKSTQDIITDPLREALTVQQANVGRNTTGSAASNQILEALARLRRTDPGKASESPEAIAAWLKGKGYETASPGMVRDTLEANRPSLSLNRINPRTQRPTDVAGENTLDVAALKGNPDWIEPLLARLNEALPGLNDKSRAALDLRFGLTTEPSTLDQVGQALKMTKQGADFNIKKSLGSLRDQLGVHIPSSAGPGGAERMLVDLKGERDAIRQALQDLDRVRQARGGPVKLDQEELVLQARLMQLDQLMSAQTPAKGAFSRTTKAGGEPGNPVNLIPDRGRVLSRGQLRVQDVPRSEYRSRRMVPESGPVRRFSPEELAAENQRRSLRQIFDLAE